MSQEQAEQYEQWIKQCDQHPPASLLSMIAYNYKQWQPERGEQLHHYFRQCSPSRYLRDESIKLVGVAEELKTMEGSGCAVLNVIHSTLVCTQPQAAGRLGLLAAGEGSRLWGVSATNAFVKALCTIFQKTLFEQTIDQCTFVLSQAPHQGQDFTIIAGTDNIWLPSQPLQTVGGRPFSQVSEGNLFFFSKEVPVLQEDGRVVSDDVLPMLEQLGIMIVDPVSSTSVAFMEKPTSEAILQTLQTHQRRSVFFNAFLFGCTTKARQTLWDLYSRVSSTGQAFYERKDFDWSTHVIEPLALCGCSSLPEESREMEWKGRWTSKQREVFPDEEDWTQLLQLARLFVEACGAPVVLNIGQDAVFYDTGLCSDLYELYRLTISTESRLKRDLMRRLLGLPLDESVIASRSLHATQGLSTDQDSLVVNSIFRQGGRVAPGSIVVNSEFEEYVEIPSGLLIINSRLQQLSFADDLQAAMIYAHEPSTQNEQLTVEDGAVYCSVLQSDGSYLSGNFPIRVVPKKGGETVLLDHYNKGDNANKLYLEQSIRGMDMSFRQLQRNSVPCFDPLPLRRVADIEQFV